MQRAYQTVDVFTGQRYAGNPLAVVLDAQGLDAQAMQAIAREFAVSETVFVLPPDNAAHAARVRIFTPTAELAFAGHPTVGTAVLLARRKFPAPAGEENAIIVLEEGIGPVRVGVRLRPDEPAFAQFDAVRLPQEAGAAAPADRLAAALSLAPSEIGFENHRPTRFSAGVPFTFVPVRDLKAIAAVKLVPQYWPEAFGGDGVAAAFVYCRETVHTSSAFHARMFAPLLLPSPEDPATGAAVVAFAGVVQHFDAPQGGFYEGVVEQGYEMNRPSAIALEFETEAGGLKVVRIGGQVVPVMSGILEA